MAIAFVQQVVRSQGGITSGGTALSSFSTTAGNLLVLTYTSTNPTSLTNVTDNASNTWHQVPGASVGFGEFTDIWYAGNLTGGSPTITVTTSATTNAELIFTEFSGVNTTTPLIPGSGANTTATGAPVGPVLTPGLSGELLITVGAGISINFTGVGAPWTGYVNVTETGGVTAYYINPPLSSQQAIFSPSSSQQYGSSGAIFQLPTSGPSSKKKASMNLVF